MDTWDKVMRLSGRKLVQIGEALGFQNLDPDAGKILITGGTGIIGHRVAQRLLLGNTAKDGNNNPLRIGCHQTESLPEFEKQGAEIVEFDYPFLATSLLISVFDTGVRNWHSIVAVRCKQLNNWRDRPLFN